MSKDKDSVKLSFALTEEEIGPYPISTEALWCVSEGAFYRVKNIPFLIEGISFDDLISIEQTGEHIYKISKIISPSKNSTLWLLINKEGEAKQTTDKLLSMGCGVEGGLFKNHFAVNIPEKIHLADVLDMLDPISDSGLIEIDYPSVRHSE